ncbi:hypothetical protein RB195_003292 [Necator americanus]|uniref:Legume-like lectin family protein n=2 Tax=Necator americanus TaxID=51031 RepID=A0ABR1DMZ0_NECAM
MFLELLVLIRAILGATAAIRRVYLPANDFSKITESYKSPRGNNRIFDFSDTNFSLVLSPSPACTTHEVLLSFFDTWIPGDALEKTQLYQRAFVLELREKCCCGDNNTVRRSDRYLPAFWIRTKESAFDGFYYNVFTYLQGKTVEMKSVWISPEYFVVRFSLSKKGTYIKSAEDESPVIKLDTNTSKYFALFSSKREHCSTFISQVDENFKIWTRDDPINVKGLPPKRPQRNNVLSAVIIALLFILFYYMFLEKVALPLYFHFKMPLPAVRRRMMKSHSPKKITFDVNLTVEEDAQDKSEPTTPTPLHTSGEAIKNTSAELSKPSTSGSKSTSMDKTQKNTKEKAKKEV